MGSFLPYGPIRITCTAEGMSSGSVEVDMVRDHFWAVRPVLSENPVVLDESTFALPSITPSPSLPFPTATEALNTGAMSQTVSRVDQWRILER
jgi:hypothetical protein